METIMLKKIVSQLLSDRGIANINPDWSGCDAVWKALEAMANEGATVIVKIDGERTSPNDTGRYTVLISGGPLASDEYFRTDTQVLEEGLAKAILYYAQKCWS